MGLILDQFVNLETQCIIAINSSIRGVSDVNNQDKLIYYVVKTIAYITLGFIVINLLVLSVWRIKLNIIITILTTVREGAMTHCLYMIGFVYTNSSNPIRWKAQLALATASDLFNSFAQGFAASSPHRQVSPWRSDLPRGTHIDKPMRYALGHRTSSVCIG